MKSCRPDDAQAACLMRYDAVRRGVLWYSEAMPGWLSVSAWGVPTPLTHCPYCGGELPTPESRVRGWMRDGWPEEGE